MNVCLVCLQLSYHTYAYYYANVNVPPDTTYSVYVRAITGNPNLYIRTDGQQPSNTFYQGISNSASGDEFINISPSLSYYNNTCTLRIAVYAFSACSFQITYATQSVVISLSDGVSQVGSIPMVWQLYNYYSFVAPAPGNDVTFALTATSGDPDMYIGIWNQSQYRPSSVPGGTCYLLLRVVNSCCPHTRMVSC